MIGACQEISDEGTSVLIVGQELSDHAEIDAGDEITAVTFTPNGKHLVIGTLGGVQVWRMKDGERVATMKVKYSIGSVVTVSKDGQFIAAVSQSNVLV